MEMGEELDYTQSGGERGSAPLAVGSRALLAVGLRMEEGPGVGSAVLLGGSVVTAGEGLGAGLCWQLAVGRAAVGGGKTLSQV